MAIQKTSRTSTYRSHAHEKYKTNNQPIAPVKPVTNGVVTHNAPVNNKQRDLTERQVSLLYQMLTKEREHANVLFHKSPKDLERFIKDFIMTYNDITTVIVAIEKETEHQVDHELQQVLMAQRNALNDFGITVRQSLYLEFNTITLRRALVAYTRDEVFIKLSGAKGVFTRLFNAIDAIIEQLIYMTQLALTDSEHIIDRKA